MKIALFGAATILGLLAASRAEAGAILYTTTDIGTSYQPLADANGQDYGVQGSNGVTYAFDKSPVTQLNVLSDNIIDGQEVRTLLTMQDGAFRVGVSTAQGVFGGLVFPSFEKYAEGWSVSSGSFPVADVNIQGQVVGTTYIVGPLGIQHFASFSAVGDVSHTPNGSDIVSDNLNNYIAAIPGVTLTSAIHIDDLGRIVAFGSDREAYLLTPAGLGGPATVPEPSTGLILGLAGSLFGLQSVRRQWGRRVSMGDGNVIT